MIYFIHVFKEFVWIASVRDILFFYTRPDLQLKRFYIYDTQINLFIKKGIGLGKI